MPNVAAGLGLLGLGVMVVVAVGTIAYSLFCDQPSHHEQYSYQRSNEFEFWNSPGSSAHAKTTRKRKKERTSCEFTGNDLCSICKDVINTDVLRKLPCHHCFHYKCIQEWFEICARSVIGTGTCPMCRKTFSAQDLI